MQRFYWPHHRELTRRVAEALGAHATCLVIEAHSLPSGPLPYEMSQDPARPEICLGTDAFHTPGWLVEAALEATRAQGWTVVRNRPFAGSIVPADYYRSDAPVYSIMIPRHQLHTRFRLVAPPKQFVQQAAQPSVPLMPTPQKFVLA